LAKQSRFLKDAISVELSYAGEIYAMKPVVIGGDIGLVVEK